MDTDWEILREYAYTIAFSFVIFSLLVYLFVGFLRRLSITPKVPISVQKVLIITAHPDDECMFFSPTIQSLINSGNFVHILCLSNGNFYGLGKTRSLELFSSCETLGVPLRNVYLFNHSDLQDHPAHPWKIRDVEKIILPVMYYLQPHLVITFDNYGVSGHSNHISIHDALQSLCNKRILPNNMRAFQLQSTSILRKYVSVLDLPLTLLTSKFLAVVSPWGLLKGWWAMLNHWSQFVWFRALYIVFSRYMLINTLEEILPQEVCPSEMEEEQPKKQKSKEHGEPKPKRRRKN
ncbi:N-acetylglucosaminyl-phosphatidylinositol de-N-acetylase-like [Saccostrea echinata]|uniref:N-acetylglucosaminyl-phosphatidylinositol de-N-acetylase-like n=1 Tax=Saccostrea echinata TaxID=191078 RepID=UPI002A8344CE|nr:N-acetylglucosaminyl-phosphatidylinositol de-N-acetylase-like [Saccostrea echinata]